MASHLLVSWFWEWAAQRDIKARAISLLPRSRYAMSQQQAIDALPAPAKRQRRRWHFWVVLLLGVFLLWLVGMYAFFAYWMDRDLRLAMAAADRDSPGGWKLADIEAQRKQIPDVENAALVVMKVMSLLPAAWPMEGSSRKKGDQSGPASKWDEKLNDMPPEVQLDAALAGSLRASLARVEPARTEARKLIEMTRGRFPLRLDSSLFVSLPRSREAGAVANLLSYEAVLASQDGDADRALAYVRGMLGAARAVGDEPLAISVWTRLTCAAQAVAALERALAQGEPSARELEAVQTLLEKEADEPLFLLAMRGERAFIHDQLLAVRQGTTSLAQVAAPLGGAGSGFLEMAGPTLVRYSHAHILDLMNQAVEAAELPLEQQWSAIKYLSENVLRGKSSFDLVTRMVKPGIVGLAFHYRSDVGIMRCASVALALERYRLDHGRWPDTLDDLVPNHLARVPKNPDGEPIHMERRPSGIIVYWGTSVGQFDRRKRFAQRVGFQRGIWSDFVLWEVKQRRQPAREFLPQPAEEQAPPSP